MSYSRGREPCLPGCLAYPYKRRSAALKVRVRIMQTSAEVAQARGREGHYGRETGFSSSSRLPSWFDDGHRWVLLAFS